MGDHSDHGNHADHSQHDPLDYAAANKQGAGGGHGGHGGHGDHMMPMSFEATAKATILFSSWVTSTWGQMFGSCIVVFLAATLYEGLKSYRERLLDRAHRKQELECSVVPCDENQVNIQVNQSAASQMLNCAHIIQVLLHILQVAASYLLMLIAMTYNVWLCLAVVLGAGCGYFLFGWRRSRSSRTRSSEHLEHCH